MKKAVVYSRYTEEFAKDGGNLERIKENWENFFENKTECELQYIYIDVNSRENYNKMMEDAKQGKFDEVHVKSVAKLGRNTEELLRCFKILEDNNVVVHFLDQNINTKKDGYTTYLLCCHAIETK